MFSATLSNEKKELQPVLKKLGIYLNKKDYLLDIKPLLKLVLSRFFGNVSCLVDSMVQHVRNSQEGTKVKVENNYRNSTDDLEMSKKLQSCDAKGPLLVNIVKLYPNESENGFNALGRIISGTLHSSDDVRVLGEEYTLEEEED
jgi:U5 small nuclear ribonucleoprotein component